MTASAGWMPTSWCVAWRAACPAMCGYYSTRQCKYRVVRNRLRCSQSLRAMAEVGAALCSAKRCGKLALPCCSRIAGVAPSNQAADERSSPLNGS